MNKNYGRASAGGIGFFGLLQLIFIVLKLCNIIQWSWVIVLLPILIETVFCIVLFILLYFWLMR